MEWLKLSAKFTRDPKIVALSSKARWAYLHSLCEVADLETDGLYALPGKPSAAARELVGAGLWERVADGLYRIPVWAKWNPTKAQLDARRNASSNAARKRWASPQEPEPHSDPQSETDADIDREVDVENTPSASAEGKAGDDLGKTLLASDSQAQYLLEKLIDWDTEWRAIGNGGLIKLGRKYGAAIVTTALGFMREEYPVGVMQPYPYLESVCVRVQGLAS